MNRLAVDIGSTFGSPFGQTKTFGDLVSLALNLAFVIAGILILALLLFAGFSMIAGAGNSDPQQSAKGRQAATAAAIGFVIVFTAYWIVRLIELIVGVNFLTAPTF